MRKIFLLTVCFVSCFQTTIAQTDKTDCQDHPVITRYPGATIEYCDTKNYSEFAIATGAETDYRTIGEWTNVAGKQTRIYYSLKGNKIVSEVYQNYITALKNGGFTLLANKMHQERNVSKDVGGSSWLVTFYQSNPFPSNVGIKINQGSGSVGDTFYVAAKKDNVHITVSGNRYSDNETVVVLDVMEANEMQDDLITVNAEFIADKLFTEGKIALQGILFDHNKSTIKDESKPLLDEIATFMKQNPTTVIFVVGHTDMTGEVDYNIDQSSKRAIAVSEYLYNQHRIAKTRLLPHGVGSLAPVNSNLSETGKAKNRRVELVLKSK